MILMRLKFRLHVLPSFSMTIHEWMTQLHRVHHSVFLPSKVETSALCSPLNCVGQTKAINGAIVDIEAAAKKAAIAADQTFLVKPVNIPMPQALSTSRLLVVHNDAAAKAAAHLLLAVKQVCGNIKCIRFSLVEAFQDPNRGWIPSDKCSYERNDGCGSSRS